MQITHAQYRTLRHAQRNRQTVEDTMTIKAPVTAPVTAAPVTAAPVTAAELYAAIDTAGRVITQLLDTSGTYVEPMSRQERKQALLNASEVLCPLYFRSTGLPLEWWRPIDHAAALRRAQNIRA